MSFYQQEYILNHLCAQQMKRFLKYKKAMKNKLANPVPATAARRATSNALGRHHLNHQPLGAMQSSLGFAASPYSFRDTISSSIQSRNNFRQDYQARRRNSVIFEDLNGAGKIEEVSSVTKKLRPQTRTKKKLGKQLFPVDVAGNLRNKLWSDQARLWTPKFRLS